MKKKKIWTFLYGLTLISGLSACDNSNEPEFPEPEHELSIIGEWKVNRAMSEACFGGACNEAELDYFLGMKFTQDNAWFYYESGEEVDSFVVETLSDTSFILRNAIWEGSFVVKYLQGDSTHLSNIMELSSGTIHDQYYLEKEPIDSLISEHSGDFSLYGEWDVIRAWSEDCDDNGCNEFELDYLTEMKFTNDSAWFYEEDGFASIYTLESLNDSTFNLISNSWQGTFNINYLQGDSTYLSNRFSGFHDQFLLKRKD